MNLTQIQELIENKEFEKAYLELSLIIEKKANHHDARFSRAYIDLIQLNSHFDTTINDLEYLIKYKTKYVDVAYSYLTMLYDDIGDDEQALYYGKRAIKYDTMFYSQICFIIARILRYTDDLENLYEALTYINLAIKKASDDDNLYDYHACKCEILIALEKYDDAEAIIEKIIGEYGHSEETYYLKSSLFLNKYYKFEEKQDLYDCINYANICLQYESKSSSIKFILAKAYQLNEEYDQALKILNTMDSNDEDVLIIKLSLYEELNEYEKGIKVIDEYLSNNDYPIWKAYYYKSMFIYQLNNDNLAEALEEIKKAYYIEPQNILLDLINETNLDLDNTLDTLNLILDKKCPNNSGYASYLASDLMLYNNFPYEDVIAKRKEAYEKRYLTEIEYINQICNYTKNPHQYDHIIKTLEKHSLTDYIFSIRRVCLRYINKENGYKQNLDKAIKILKNYLDQNDPDACTVCLYGWALYLNKQEDEALKQITLGYNLLKEIEEPECFCSIGYYAYLNLVGCANLKDEEKAKELILNVVNKKMMNLSSLIAYLYVYFYLQGDQRFTYEKAYKLITCNYLYYRYEITRIVYMMQLARKTQQNIKELEKLEQTLDQFSAEDKAYYQENINKEFCLPFWRNI